MSSKPTSGIIKNTLSLGTATVICIALGLAYTIIVIRNFPTDIYGLYTLISIVVSFLITLGSLGLEMTISRFIAAADIEEKNDLFNTAISARICAIIIVCILSWLIRPLLGMIFGQQVAADAVFVFVPLLFIFDSSRSILKSILQGHFKFSAMGISDIIYSFFNLVFASFFVFFHSMGLTELIFSRFFATVLCCLFAYISIPKNGKFKFQFVNFKKIFKFGFPLQINDIINFIFARIDSIIIGALLGPTNIAIYEVARGIPDTLQSLFEPFRSVFYPFLSKFFEKGDQKGAARLINDSTRIVSFAVLSSALFIILFGEDVIKLLFTEKYLLSVPILKIQMVGLCVSLLCNVLGTSLVAVGDSSKPMYINFVHVVVKVVGNFIFIPMFSLIGAAVVGVVGELSAFPLNFVFLYRKIKINIIAFAKPIIIFGVVTCAGVLVSPASFLIKCVWFAAYLVACVGFAVITKDDVVRVISGSGILNYPFFKKFKIG